MSKSVGDVLITVMMIITGFVLGWKFSSAVDHYNFNKTAKFDITLLQDKMSSLEDQQRSLTSQINDVKVERSADGWTTYTQSGFNVDEIRTRVKALEKYLNIQWTTAPLENKTYPKYCPISAAETEADEFQQAYDRNAQDSYGIGNAEDVPDPPIVWHNLYVHKYPKADPTPIYTADPCLNQEENP